MRNSFFAALSFACAASVGACTTADQAEPDGDPVEATATATEALASTAVVAACPANVCDAHHMIIGCDERSAKPVGVSATTTSPWRHVGRLNTGCTGTLIGDRWVLTAAHCLTEAPTTNLRFSLAQSATFTCGLGTTYVKRAFYPTAFHATDDQLDRAYDYAVLELWSPITGGVPMAFDYIPWSTIHTKPIYSIGYPSTDKIPGSLWETGTSAVLTSPNAWLDGGEAGALNVDTDAEGGQSGAPVYAFIDGIRTVVGVLVGSSETACEAGANWAARLTPGALDHIDNAMTPNVIDFFWHRIDLPYQPATAGCS